MKVKCIANTKMSLPESLDCKACSGSAQEVFPIDIDAEYTVYAISVTNGYSWYYIEDERGELSLFPAPLFQVIDNRLSQYWVFSFVERSHLEFPRSIFAFPEWAADYQFYTKIQNYFERELNLFTNYKNLMDFEFPDPSLKAQASVIDHLWIQCPKCSDAWESITTVGKITCPSCHAILNNPRYPVKPTDLKAWLNYES